MAPFSVASINLNSLIEEVQDLLYHSFHKKVEIIKEFGAEKMVVAGDATQLQNSLLNIAINAGKAMPDGGTLTFRTENLEIKEKSADSPYPELDRGQYIKLIISDTGIGMDKPTMEKIFEPFFTTRPLDGLGMGLSVAYGTIKSHKGCIDVTSQPGKGTSFTICLPINSRKISSPVEKPGARSLSKLKYNVLLVDDEKEVCQSMAEALELFGLSVITYSDSRKAISYYQKAFADIDLVLLDMVMPVVNGYETFVEMQQINPAIKAIAFTGFTMAADANDMMSKGVELVAKPIEPHVLAEKIISEIEGRTTG